MAAPVHEPLQPRLAPRRRTSSCWQVARVLATAAPKSHSTSLPSMPALMATCGRWRKKATASVLLSSMWPWSAPCPPREATTRPWASDTTWGVQPGAEKGLGSHEKRRRAVQDSPSWTRQRHVHSTGAQGSAAGEGENQRPVMGPPVVDFDCTNHHPPPAPPTLGTPSSEPLMTAVESG